MGKSNMSKLFKSIQKSVSKHSPEILLTLGIGGMITSTVLAVRATPKALALMDAKKEELQVDKLTPVDTIKTTWKCYIPAAISGATSIVCLIGANSTHVKRHAALAAAYKLSETALTEYREKVVETVGEKKEQAIRDKVSEEQVRKHPVAQSEILVTGKGNDICFEPLTHRYFYSDADAIRRAETTLNKRILTDINDTVTLNEFFDELNIPRAELGDSVGWNIDHTIDLDLGTQLTEGDRPCITVGHYEMPRYDYL